MDRPSTPRILFAEPNPIQVGGGRSESRLGRTELSWVVDAGTVIEVRVDAPDGPVLSRAVGPGRASTGCWVRDGMTFFLQQVTGCGQRATSRTLATETVRVQAAERIDFGDLRRVNPVSTAWGFDRGTPIDRHYIAQFIRRHRAAIRGRVLEVGDDGYTRTNGSNVQITDILNVNGSDPKTTVVADLADAPHLPSNAYDCAIVTQTLQLIYDVRAAVRTLHRVLAPGGVLLVTVPGVTQTYDANWSSSWYWAFTHLSAHRLMLDVFDAAAISVESFGNVLAATSFLHGLAAEELTPDELAFSDVHYPVTIGVRASKTQR